MHVDIIAAEERGITQSEWLDSYHTYSFGQYHNPKRFNFGTLRVFNEDNVEPSAGFHTHSHDNMEIITIVLEGALEHKDNTGTRGIIRAGDIQRMTAGSGIKHSENNASDKEKVHFLQIWVYPETRDLAPSYEQKTIDPKRIKNTFYPIVSKSPKEDALSIHQDATFFLGHFDKEQKVEHTPASEKHGDYLFVIDGEVALGNKVLKAGDSAQITQVDKVLLKMLAPSKLLLIEVGVNTL